MRSQVFSIARNTWLSLRHKNAVFMMIGVILLALIVPTFLHYKFFSMMNPPGQDNNEGKTIITFTKLSLLVAEMISMIFAVHLVSTEVNQRSISAVMIRPIHRWEFLLGKVSGVLFYFFVFTSCVWGCAYVISFLTHSSLANTFTIGVFQRLFRGMGFIFIATAMGAVMRPVYAIMIFIFFLFLSIVFAIIPLDAHWFLTSLHLLFHYASPSSLSNDFIGGFDFTADQKSTVIGLLSMFENLMYGIFMFLCSCWIFNQRDIKLKDD